ncbi:glycosyltransferase family 4 protein [Streptomyces sp. NPDC005181]|uniref:glycosyltransferase family 4 protein n=1 Tax=Streptomyces sp. NPDC005181 TaxID=3156869 RepID=UPI0033B112FC
MRIALVHSFYGAAVPGGENEAVRDQAAALHRAGHEVLVHAAHTDALRTKPLYPLGCAVTVATGRGRSPARALRAFAPDVVHIHNLFPNFGRRWVESWKGPLVTTLHNYRPMCAAATLHRDGASCTRCPDGDRWAGLRHGCYRDSRLATLPLAWAGLKGAADDPLLRRADRVVFLSELSRDTYLATGLPPARAELIPNFVPDVTAQPAGQQDAWVYVGRLTPEKGILDLLRRWPGGERLDVIGNGPLDAECRRHAPSSVRFLGPVDRDTLRPTLASYRGLVFPSQWLEGLPLVYLEALVAGLPVLVFGGSAVAASVQREGTGTVISWHTPLAAALQAASRDFPALRTHCRDVYLRQYGESLWLQRTLGLYERLCRSTAPLPRAPQPAAHRPLAGVGNASDGAVPLSLATTSESG